MHFSIPDTLDINDENGTSFKGYNIHINGAFHCTVRFKQLHNLHEQLRKEYGASAVPCFPPKKLLPLSVSQLEERRLLLEKYIQSIGQDSELVSSELLKGFLLSAQYETSCQQQEMVHCETMLEVYLMNGSKITLDVLTTDRSDQVLAKMCNQINLPPEYVSYFSLFLIRKEENNTDAVILRKLQDFESPYISHRAVLEPNRIVVRKSYWDSAYDIELMKNSAALGLLYAQMVWDMERGWITCEHETQAQLTSLQARGAKYDYLELARTLKHYGYMQFATCICDVPRPGTPARVSIGQHELSIRTDGRESSFRVTRMRCWRITAIHNNNARQQPQQLELSFQYLVCKDRLRWVTIASEQAILISVCLQSVVDELLLKRRGPVSRSTTLRPHPTYTYMRRDGSSQLISPPDTGLEPSPNDNSFSIRGLQKKFASVSFKSEREFVENHAFEGIGDEDL